HLQELLGIFTEFVQKQSQISCRAAHIVIELGIFEEFASRAIPGIEVGRSLLQILPGLTPGGEEAVVSGQFAQRAAARAQVREEGIAIIEKLPGAVMEAGIENKFTERTLLLFDGAHDVIEPP